MPLFRRLKADVVVVAVRYQESGNIEWVRVFERRGPTWSDRKNIRREELVERIRTGENVVAGERVQYEAGTFIFGEPLRIEEKAGREIVLAAAANGQGDDLGDVPIV